MSGREHADDVGRGPKRLSRDPHYRARVDLADQYHLPLSELGEWAVDDLDAALGKRLFEGELCGSCGTHPSVTNPQLGGNPNAVLPVWKHCRVCELIEKAKKAGPPSDDLGWHLTLKHTH